MQEDNQLALHDAALVSAEHGAAQVVEHINPTPVAAAVPSSLIGALIGAIAVGPLGFLIGGVLAGITGAAVAWFADTGIPHRVITQMRRRLRPGEAVVALLVDEGDTERVSRLPGARVIGVS
jgi:uncharacterized membrane protein